MPARIARLEFQVRELWVSRLPNHLFLKLHGARPAQFQVSAGSVPSFAVHCVFAISPSVRFSGLVPSDALEAVARTPRASLPPGVS